MANKKTKKELLRNNPFCIYCGGAERSTNIDHMPNKGMFPKDRPSGLEFPCCEACNQGSKWFEDITSLICSIRFDITDKGTDHFGTKFKHLLRNHPEVIEELWPQSKQLQYGASISQDSQNGPAKEWDLSGNIVSAALLLYGAKLAMALHWEKTKQILKCSEQVGVIFFSNKNQIENTTPSHLSDLLPNWKELHQGIKKSSQRFFWSSGKATDTGATAHGAIFGDAIYYNLFAGGTLNLTILPANQRFSPGCLQTSKPRPRLQPTGWSLGPVILSS